MFSHNNILLINIPTLLFMAGQSKWILCIGLIGKKPVLQFWKCKIMVPIIQRIEHLKLIVTSL